MPHRLFRCLLALLAGISAASFIGAAAQAGRTVCSGVIQITSLAFNPPTVAPGQVSAATLSAWNCTDQTQQTSATWQGRFTSPIGPGGLLRPGARARDREQAAVPFRHSHLRRLRNSLQRR